MEVLICQIKHLNIGLGSYCWWGSTPLNTSLFTDGSGSQFYYGMYLGSDPRAVFAKPTIQREDVISDSPVAEFTDTSIYYCEELREQNKYTEAMEFILSYPEDNPDDQAAYLQFYNCYNKNTSLASRAKLNNLFISLYNEDNIDGAIDILNDVLGQSELTNSSELEDAAYAIESYARIHKKKSPKFVKTAKMLLLK
jgi:hypothetical protein